MKVRIAIATLALLCFATAQASPGRLFYTAEQRAVLEKARLQNRTQAPVSGTPAPPRPVTYDGFVQRSDGHTTRWVNGKVQGSGAITLNVRGYKLLPGQTLDGRQVYEAHGIRRPEAKDPQ